MHGPRLLVAILSLAALASLALATVPLAAQPPSGPPRLIADLSDTTEDLVEDVTILGRFQDHVYFGAVGPVYGGTLWRTDGTEAGTEPFADLCPGTCGPTSLSFFVTGDSRAYFVASYYEELNVFDGDLGTFHELWTTDGTREGTERLLRLDGPAATFRELGTVGDRLYFAAGDLVESPGVELWTSDGTGRGTRLLADLCPGLCGSTPGDMVPYDGALYFSASEPETGREVWRADPETDAVELVRDLCPGECGRAAPVAVFGDDLYLVASHPDSGSEPWVSDGTGAGTRLLVDARPGPDGSSLETIVSVAGQVHLTFTRVPPGLPQVFRTDGTPAGTAPAVEIDDALRGHRNVTFARVTHSPLLYFASETDPDSFEQTLRVFDPGTSRIRDLAGGLRFTSRTFEAGFLPGSDTLVFSASEQGFGDEPWISDGTAAGTGRLRDVDEGSGGSQATDILAAGDRLVFSASEDNQEHLWTTDGTTSGTVRVSLDPASPSFPSSLTRFAGRLWFSARPGDVRELWRTTADGLGAEPVAPGVPAGAITAAGGRLFFQRRFGAPATLDPASLEPVTLASVQTGSPFVQGPGGLVHFGTRGQGEELWATDGTPEGTRLVIDIDPESFDPCSLDDLCPPGTERFAQSFPRELTLLGNHLYFAAVPPGDAHFLPGLWRTDGSAAGTEWLSEVTPGVETIVSLGGRIVLHVDIPRGIQEIWTVAPGGTPQVLTDLGGSPIGGLTAVGGVAYFFAEVDGTVELHRTAGTPASTRKVADIPGASRIAHVGRTAGLGSRLFFSAFSPETGTELWTSDGTAGGTGLVADLHPGRGDANPRSFTGVGSHLVFAADDGEHGHEPWVTDGTAAGTVLLTDLAPGPRPSSPDGFTAVGRFVYFEADDGSGRGRELWALDAGGPGGDDPDPVVVPDDAVGILAPEYPGFRFWVRISAGGQTLPARRELLCLPETVCVSGALPGRSELFLRIVGPRPNGFLWPILVRFTTSRVEVWIEQASTGALQHYVLDAATPGSDELDGLFDRRGFPAD